jgi:hypothetical protein
MFFYYKMATKLRSENKKKHFYIFHQFSNTLIFKFYVNLTKKKYRIDYKKRILRQFFGPFCKIKLIESYSQEV